MANNNPTGINQYTKGGRSSKKPKSRSTIGAYRKAAPFGGKGRALSGLLKRRSGF